MTYPPDPKPLYDDILAGLRTKVQSGGVTLKIIGLVSAFDVVWGPDPSSSAHFIPILGVAYTVDRLLSSTTAISGRLPGAILTIGTGVLLWILGRNVMKGRTRALSKGTIFYALDGAILLYWRQWGPAAFHLCMVLSLLSTLRTAAEFRELHRQAIEAGVYAPENRET
jgi:hypothetical protein